MFYSRIRSWTSDEMSLGASLVHRLSALKYCLKMRSSECQHKLCWHGLFQLPWTKSAEYINMSTSAKNHSISQICVLYPLWPSGEWILPAHVHSVIMRQNSSVSNHFFVFIICLCMKCYQCFLQTLLFLIKKEVSCLFEIKWWMTFFSFASKRVYSSVT